MPQVRLSARAQSDIVRLHSFLLSKNAKAAERARQAIQQIGNGEVIINNTSRSHDEAVVELLREDPTFADEYLAAAIDEINQDGGRQVLLSAMFHVAKSLAQDN